MPGTASICVGVCAVFSRFTLDTSTWYVSSTPEQSFVVRFLCKFLTSQHITWAINASVFTFIQLVNTLRAMPFRFVSFRSIFPWQYVGVFDRKHKMYVNHWKLRSTSALAKTKNQNKRQIKTATSSNPHHYSSACDAFCLKQLKNIVHFQILNILSHHWCRLMVAILILSLKCQSVMMLVEVFVSWFNNRIQYFPGCNITNVQLKK